MKTTKPERLEMQQEALSRAVGSNSMANFIPIIEGFAQKGIAVDDIRPRENVFTYNAWRALGRQVRKGEHGVKVTTWIPVKGKEDEAESKEIEAEADTGVSGADKEPAQRGGFRPWTATVFHLSQTDPI